MSQSHPKTERTFIIIKPDGIQRGLIGEIIHRIERTGLKIVTLSFMQADESRLWEHYNKDEEWYLKKGTKIVENRKKADMPIEKEPIDYGKDIIRVLVKFMVSSPVVMMAVQGNQAVAIVKKLVGETEPATSDVGTIRGDLTVDSYEIATIDDRAVRNLVHCSDAPEEAEREIALWLEEDQVLKYRLVNEQILYDVNLDGVLE